MGLVVVHVAIVKEQRPDLVGSIVKRRLMILSEGWTQILYCRSGTAKDMEQVPFSLWKWKFKPVEQESKISKRLYMVGIGS